MKKEAKEILEAIALGSLAFGDMFPKKESFPITPKLLNSEIIQLLRELKTHNGKNLKSINELFDEVEGEPIHKIFITNSFRGVYENIPEKDKSSLKNVILKLSNGENLDSKYRIQNLLGGHLGCKKLRINSDLLLIYRYNFGVLELGLAKVSEKLILI